MGRARYDEKRLRSNSCLAFERVTVPPHYEYGNARASITVALISNSHAAQWFPALGGIGAARDLRVLTFVKVACPFVEHAGPERRLEARVPRMPSMERSLVVSKLSAARPDLTIMSMSRCTIQPILDRDTTVAHRCGAAIARLINGFPDRRVDRRRPGGRHRRSELPSPGMQTTSSLRHPAVCRVLRPPGADRGSGDESSSDRRSSTSLPGSAKMTLVRSSSNGGSSSATRAVSPRPSPRWLAGDLDRELAVFLVPGLNSRFVSIEDLTPLVGQLLGRTYESMARAR